MVGLEHNNAANSFEVTWVVYNLIMGAKWFTGDMGDL